MIITLSRTGGFTGIPQKKTIDTQKLALEIAKKIEKILEDSHFFTRAESPKSTPDRFIYTISVQQDEFSRSLTVDEQSLDSLLKELINILETA